MNVMSPAIANGIPQKKLQKTGPPIITSPDVIIDISCFMLVLIVFPAQ